MLLGGLGTRFGTLGAGLGTCGGSGIDPASLYANDEGGDFWQAFDLVGALDASVQTLAGKRGRHNFTQATTATRPLLRARADGVRYLDFAGGKSMSVASSTALFKYLHDGTGGTVLAFVDWPQGEIVSNLFATAGSSAQTGLIVNKLAGSQRLNLAIERGTSGVHTATTALVGYPVAGVDRPVFFRLGYKNEGQASDLIGSFNGSLTRFEAGTSNAPGSADAARNLSIETTFLGKLYALLVISRKLSDAEVRGIYVHWQARILGAISPPDLTLLVGGQSNASGRGALVTAPVPVSGVSILDRAEEYRGIYEPSHNIINQPVATVPAEPQDPRNSFLTVAGNALKEDAGQNSLWVPCAVGSTSLTEWDHPEDAGDRAKLFGAAVYRMNKALAEKGGAPVVVWYGHESGAALVVPDYVGGGVGGAYQAAWTSLMANLRTRIGTAPVIFVQLAPTDDLTASVQQQLVAEAQRQTELTVANSYMVVAHDVLRNAAPDDQHVATAGFAVVGERVALAIRQHVLGEAVNGTGPRITGATYTGSTVTLACDKPVNSSAGDYGGLFRVYDGGVEAGVSSATRSGDTSRIDIVCSAPLSGPVTLTYGGRAGLASAARTDFVADADGLPLPLFGPVAVPAA